MSQLACPDSLIARDGYITSPRSSFCDISRKNLEREPFTYKMQESCPLQDTRTQILPPTEKRGNQYVDINLSA